MENGEQEGVAMPGIPFETPVGFWLLESRPIGSFPTTGACTGWVTGIENVRDLSGAEEMSEYYNKHKLYM